MTIFEMNAHTVVVMVLFLVLSPWPSTGDALVHLLKPSAGRVRGGGDDGEFMVKRGRTMGEGFPMALVRAVLRVESVTESLRRLLKAARNWCYTHPTEVKLGTCLASYFNIKIPGLRRGEQIAAVKDYLKFTGVPELGEIPAENRQDGNPDPEEKSSATPATTDRPVMDNVVEAVREIYETVKAILRHYQNLLTGNPLVLCAWNYSVKKFWTWVDAAPID